MMSSGTRVNWRKGFFRVWVLGAVLWMPLSALVVAGELSEANRRQAHARSASGLFDDIPMATSEGTSGSGMFDDLIPAVPGNTTPQEEMPDEWAAFPDAEEKIAPGLNDDWGKDDPLASEVAAAAAAGAALDASDYSRVAAVAFLPPLVVLIAGFALGWVYRGFRAS